MDRGAEVGPDRGSGAWRGRLGKGKTLKLGWNREATSRKIVQKSSSYDHLEGKVVQNTSLNMEAGCRREDLVELAGRHSGDNRDSRCRRMGREHPAGDLDLVCRR